MSLRRKRSSFRRKPRSEKRAAYDYAYHAHKPLVGGSLQHRLLFGDLKGKPDTPKHLRESTAPLSTKNFSLVEDHPQSSGTV